MKKNIKIVIVIFVIIVVLVVIYLFLFKQPAQQPTIPSQPPQAQLPSPPPAATFSIPPKDSDKMTIATLQGNLEVNNLYKNPVADLPGNGIAFKETTDYHMDFYPQDEGFIISIQNPDIQVARDKAEADFLQMLNITREQACLLKITLGVPYDVNQQAAGQNYGLSFCPNGKSFTK